MSTTGLKLCTSGVTDSSSPADWVNPGNITAKDGTYTRAESESGGGEDSSNLIATGFDFSAIPEDATLVGIVTTVRLMTGAGSFDVVYDTDLSLIVNGAAEGDNKADVTAWPASFTDKSYGGIADLWNTTTPLTVLLVQDTVNFGVNLRCYITGGGTGNPTYADVDSVEMTIYYTGGAAIATGKVIIMHT